MQIPDDFVRPVELALKVANLSAARWALRSASKVGRIALDIRQGSAHAT